MTLSVALLSLVLHGYFALQVLFATRELGMSAGDLGLALMIGGAGALLAGAISTGLAARIGIGRVLVFGYALTALGWTAIAFLPPSQTAGTLVLGLGIGVFEFGQTLFVVSYVSLRQALTPDHMLGRVIGTMRFLTVAAAPLGSSTRYRACAGASQRPARSYVSRGVARDSSSMRPMRISGIASVNWPSAASTVASPAWKR